MPLIGAFLILLLWCGAALAQSCTVTATDLAFGPVDTLAAAPVDTTGSIELRCTGIQLLGSIRGRISLSQGSGGGTGGLRQMESADTSTPLAYQIYSNSGRTAVWGSPAGPGTPVSLSTFSVLLLGTGRAVIPVYARIPGGQASVAPSALYRSQFTGIQAEAAIEFCSVLVLCNPQTVYFSFDVSADVPKACTVTADPLDFGTVGVLARSIDAQSRLRLRCTAQTPASIGLDAGQAPAGGMRQMVGPGGNAIRYGLYRNPARSQPWGASGSGEEGQAIGTGDTLSIPIYGRVPPQPTPPPGTYADTVVVTVTY